MGIEEINQKSGAVPSYMKEQVEWVRKQKGIEANLKDYEEAWESPYDGIEELLVQEIPIEALRRFLDDAKERSDYPQMKKYMASMSEDDIRALAKEVLKARKGEAHGYVELVIEHCHGPEELPRTLKAVLESIHWALNGPGTDWRDPASKDRSEVTEAGSGPTEPDDGEG